MIDNQYQAPVQSGRGDAVTEFEERVWMHHQHNDDGSAQYSAAYHLIGKINIGRLVSSLSKLSHFVPSLNTAYYFEENAGLIKHHNGSSVQTINIEAVDSVQAAIAQLQSKQVKPLALDSQSPVQFTVYVCAEKEVVLGVISHQILNGEVSWKELFEVLSALYNHGLGSVEEPVQPTHVIGFTPLEKLNRLSNSQLPWIKRSAQNIDLIQAGVHQDVSAHLQSPVPRKFATSVQRSTYEGHLGRTMTELEILSTTAILFSRYITESNGLDHLNVFVPTDIRKADSEMNGAMIESGLAHLR